jgi:hypothetical protein
MATNHRMTIRDFIADKVRTEAMAGGGSPKIVVYGEGVVLAEQLVNLSMLGAPPLHSYEFDCNNLPQIPNALESGAVTRVELQDSTGMPVVISMAPMAGIPASATAGEPFAFKSWKYTAP